MNGPLHNLNDALAHLEKTAVRTDRGSFIRVEDLKEAIKQQGDAASIDRATAPRPKTMAQAKRMARADEELMKLFPDRNPLPPGKSVPASVPESVSRP